MFASAADVTLSSPREKYFCELFRCCVPPPTHTHAHEHALFSTRHLN